MMKTIKTLLIFTAVTFIVTVLTGSGSQTFAHTTDQPAETLEKNFQADTTTAMTVVPIGINFPIVRWKGNENQGKPGVAFDGTNFLTVWMDQLKFSIYAARVSWDGKVLDPEGILIANPAGDIAQPSVGFDGENFFVTWEQGGPLSGNIMGARISPEGQVLDPGGVKLTTESQGLIRMPGLAFDGTNFLIVWRSFVDVKKANIHGIRVSTTGESIVNLDGDQGIKIASGGENKFPDAAFDGTNFLVVYSYEHPDETNDIDIYGTRLTAEGTVLDPDGFVICDAPMDQENPTVGFDGTNYQVAWYDYRPLGNDIYGSAYGARVKPDGSVLDDPAYQIADRTRGQIPVQVNCDGEECLAVWSVEYGLPWDSVNARLSDVYLRRLSKDGGVLDQGGVPVSTSYGHQFAPVIGYGDGRYLVAWGESVGRESYNNRGVWGQLLEEQSIASPASTHDRQSSQKLASLDLDTASADSEWEKEILQTADAYISGGMASSADYSFAYGNGVYSYTHGTWERYYVWDKTYAGFLYEPGEAWAGGWCRSTIRYEGDQWEHRGCWSENDTYDIVTGMWGTGFRNIFASCDRGDIIWYDGFWEWFTVDTGVGSDLWDIYGFAIDDIFTAGNWGKILHYDGKDWTQFENIPTVQSLNSLWGSGSKDVFAVGDYGTVLHYDGVSWRLMDSGTLEHLFGVWGTDSSDVYAVGFNGTILHYDGVSWQAEDSGTTQDLLGVWGVYDMDAGKEVIWIGGRGEVVLKKTIPIVGFNAAPPFGTAPLDTTFTNTTGLSYTTSTWDFGDGDTSTAAAPSHRYESTGNYTVTLTLVGPDGQLKLERPEYVKVEEPITGLTATHDGPTLLGEPTTLKAWVETGTNVVYNWDLGLLTDIGQTVSRIYPEIGFYYVWVTATNSVSEDAYRLGVWIVEEKEYESFLPLVVQR